MPGKAPNYGIAKLPPPPFVDNAPTILDEGSFDAQENSEAPQPAVPAAPLGKAEPVSLPVKATSVETPVRVEEAPEPAISKKAAPLPDSWLSTQKSRREVPKAVKMGALVTLGIICLVFVLPKACGSQDGTTHSSMISEDDVANSEFLKKRRHLTDEDFRPRGAGPIVVEAKESPSPPEPSEELSLEERQRMRAENPEDLRASQPRGSGRSRHTTQREEKKDESPFIFFNRDPARERSGRDQEERAEVLLPAATSVKITLSHDVVIRSGRATVVATVAGHQSLPAGTKLLGRASASFDGTVSLKFQSAVLPNGNSLKVRAEAVDSDTGSTSLLGSVTGGPQLRESPSVARSVGTSTAGRLATGLLGGGIAGEAANQTLTESNRSRGGYQRSATVTTLAGDSRLEALFLQEVLQE